MKPTTLYILFLTATLLISCHKEPTPQSVAGFIDKLSGEQQITIEVIDSAGVRLQSPRKMSFIIDDNTLYESNGLVEGNIVEVLFTPTDNGQSPSANEISTDDTYPRALGRWLNSEHEKLDIDIELLPAGRIRQHQPQQTVSYDSWQLTGRENEITISGRVSLPPIVEKSKGSITKKSKSDEQEPSTAPARRTMEFTTTAVIGIDGDRRTLTIITDNKHHSKLYRVE